VGLEGTEKYMYSHFDSLERSIRPLLPGGWEYLSKEWFLQMKENYFIQEKSSINQINQV
jgi:hypothetical protein